MEEIIYKQLFEIIGQKSGMPTSTDSEVMDLFNKKCVEGEIRTGINEVKKDYKKKITSMSHEAEIADYKCRLLETSLFFAINTLTKETAFKLVDIAREAGVTFSLGGDGKPNFEYRGLDDIIKRHKNTETNL